MPITTIKIVRGVFSEEQKSAMIQGVTEAMVKVTGEEKRDGNWVIIEETNPGEWAIGGKARRPIRVLHNSRGALFRLKTDWGVCP